MRIAAVPALGRVGSVDAEAVEGAGRDLGDVAVPGEAGAAGEIEAADLAARVGGVIEADLDAGGDARVDGEVRAVAVEGGATREGLAGPDAHGSGGPGRGGREAEEHASGVFSDGASENKGGSVTRRSPWP